MTADRDKAREIVCPYCDGEQVCDVCHGSRQIERTIYFDVATLLDPAAEPFAVVRIDVSKRSGDGVEGVVDSLHWSREVAQATADTLNRAFSQEVHHA